MSIDPTKPVMTPTQELRFVKRTIEDPVLEAPRYFTRMILQQKWIGMKPGVPTHEWITEWRDVPVEETP